MNNKGKSEPELMELKKVPFEENKKDLTPKNYQNIIIIILVICLCVIIGVSFFAYEKVSKDFKLKIQEKDNEIEKIQQQINNLKELRKVEKNKEQLEKIEESKKKLTRLQQEYLFDSNFYIENNMRAKEDLNRLGYNIIFTTHTLEKGMSHFVLRPFAEKKTEHIINLLKLTMKYEGFRTHFAFINGINSLREYKKIYENHYWTVKEEYKKVSDFLKDYNDVPELKTGAYIMTKEELKKNYTFDYKKFVMSRHSTRNYKHEQLKLEDIREAVEMAKYTPSACNRQYVKLHYYPEGKMRENVIKYALGKGGLYLEGANTFIITFDVNGLQGAGERNQGYFNAGLFATNLVNAFHSLGIGTCYIQFANSVKEEEDLKKMNGIPSYERIAVILFAGYYDEKSIFAVSPRKSVEEYFTEHK